MLGSNGFRVKIAHSTSCRRNKGREPWGLEAPPRPFLPTLLHQPPGLSRGSHCHFGLAGAVAGVVAGDVVQLLHGVVFACGEGLALGRCLALAQRGVGVTGGTGM